MPSRYTCVTISRLPRKYAKLFLTQTFLENTHISSQGRNEGIHVRIDEIADN